MMNDNVFEALKHSRYKVFTDKQDLEAIYRLRYKCYRAEGLVAESERAIMTDAFDQNPNCVHVAIEVDGEIRAAMRLHLLSRLSAVSPSLEVFPEIADHLNRGKTVLDPTRFVIDPAARKMRVPLHFLALRIPFLAAMFYDIDLALASVRTEHIAFYRRHLGFELALHARDYPGLKKPLHLLTSKFREQRDAVLARTPVFGPVDQVPHANIAFPTLSGIYVASKEGRSAAA
ncbi:MAG: GNAT family N-acetyltransferase [Pseudotabrizicola sp.]|uniref:N-acyl amino acid synthase FeeM domain-containing protein n=1 Tax=Pseudotabrizicola sp. TaxID=2939647 RepID=UPI0027201B32|nr:GNAT family N-acetyltransferase [Pseudotabrizicola sp.]MDO9638453.1 GNAT family N-acetyltransferase [Pseudotabrizicola sp.]